jgi:carboxymethylenebutenolidase
MKRLLSSLAVLAVLGAPAWSAEEKVTFGNGGSGLLVTPAGKGPSPAVIVIQEWWGLDEWVKDQARALAREGYVALAVDLYRGKVTDKQEEAHQYMSGLSSDQALSDLVGAYAFLTARPDVKKDRIGSIGWCMGGRYSLELATREPKLAAAVAYYGAAPTDEAAIARIGAPVLGNYGGDDKGPSPEAVRAFEAAMKKAGKKIDVKVYDGAPHAFANPNNPWGGYRETAARDAWARTTAFFAANLKK